MNKNWKLFEKVISGFQIIFGITTISFLLWSLNLTITIIFENSDYTWNDVSFYKLFKNHYFFTFLGILSISSGILLLKNKKIGWILSVSTWLLYGFGTLINIFKKNDENEYIFASNSDFIILGIIIVTFLILALCLTLKPFRTKYKPNLKSWFKIGIITLILITAKLLIK
ncbi:MULTISPECIES: hypothetical protein [Flagellimonas]|uniref:Uncharacterized protein n=1 Tax=Flagellimonas hadalis TaxID=2597517 RepID=A0A5N5IZT4_9FLAO|nr:hypothetical protein [Allomuricauda hadalis]KAB5483112.1 hypothetical protein FOT42_017840 [Allomuricauda hadalis]